MATFDDVRRICGALPETVEVPWFGTPSFKVKGKGFCRWRDEDGLVVVWVADLAEKDALLSAEPDKFTTTPHYDGHPTVLVRLENLSVPELAELLTDAWRARAPKRALQAFEAAGGAPPA
ncbi:MAG: MmcQ/YjbR family DNA-binding protein [Acidimicrobiia bacterium]